MATTVSNSSELISAVDNAGAGDEIVAQGGTYNMSSRWRITASGADGNQLVIRAADGQNPHIKFAAGGSQDSDSGIEFESPYVTFKGFEVSGSGWKGVAATSNAHHAVFEDLEVHDGNLWGIMNNGNDEVVFRNCDSYDNFDGQNDGQNSDGFTIAGPANNCLVEGCRAWANGDDGFDFFDSNDHTVRYCWAWNNGAGGTGNGNGFKLGAGDAGGGGHIVHDCVAFKNKVDNNSYSPGSGFWWNGEETNPIEVYNCTAWDNGVNFAFNDIEHVLKNNVSYQGGYYGFDAVEVGGPVIEEANSWNQSYSDPEFQSLDSSSDGFLKLAASSPAIDAGVDVGLDYKGDAPDLGAFEYSGDSTSESTRLPVDGSVTFDASQAKHNSESKLNTNHSGFNGSGYLNFVPNSGAYANWPLEVSSADTYGYQIRYANGGSSGRTVEVSYAGTSQQLTFPATGGWDQWDTVTGKIDLPSGAVDLVLETIGEDGGNVDQLQLWPVEDEQTTKPTTGTPNHGYNTPEQGQSDWHVPLNENFAQIDRDVPIVDADGVKVEYEPTEGTLYFATDTGSVYVGDGSEWTLMGSLN